VSQSKIFRYFGEFNNHHLADDCQFTELCSITRNAHYCEVLSELGANLLLN